MKHLFASLVLLATTLAPAAEPYAVLDDTPKVIFYLSNSHKGYNELQQHLDHGGFGHVKVHNVPMAYHFKLDAKTGELRKIETLEGMLKIAKEKYPDHDILMVRQNNSGPYAEKAPAKDAVIQSDAAYFLRFRELLMEHGFKDFYLLNHHYSKGPDNAERSYPAYLEAITAMNKTVGYEIGIDNWPVTKAYFPRTVSFDYWHNNHFGRLAKTAPLVAAMARNSGITDYPRIDLDKALEAFEAEHLKFLDITPVGQGQRYAVGDTIDITWQAVDADLYPRVHLLLEVNGGKDKMIIAENVLNANGHYRWTIPDAVVKLPKARGRGAPIVSKQCRIRISAALKKLYSVSAKAPGFFEIVPAGSEADTPELPPPPAAIPDNLRTNGDLKYRVARWPGFYRAAIAIAIEDDGSSELFDQLKAMSEREHPDLMTVIATGQDAGRYDALRKMGHQVVTSLPVQAGDTQTTYRVLPEALEAAQTYHFETGSEAAMRALITQVIAEGSAAFVTYGARGADWPAQINALHDFHAELWNGPMQQLLTYVDQGRSATLSQEGAYKRNQALRFTLTDATDAKPAVPLAIQVGFPRGWRGTTACTQGENARWFGDAAGPEGAKYIRFEAVPGDVAIEIK